MFNFNNNFWSYSSLRQCHKWNCSNWNSATSGNLVGLASTAVFGYGVVYQDTLVSFRYPNLENGNYSTDNPLDSGADVSVTSSNAGIGKVNTFTQNNGTQLGNVFAITGGGGSCTGWDQFNYKFDQ